MPTSRLLLLSISVAFALSGCAAQQTREADAEATSGMAPAMSAPAVAGRDDVNAVIWMQTATEFEALCRQAFTIAEMSVRTAVENKKLLESMGDGSGPLKGPFEEASRQQVSFNALVESERTGANAAMEPLAVIADVDETLIDNTPYQARNIIENLSFERPRWDAWSNERQARALPGAVEFANFLSENGVTFFYVTNRDVSLREATADNLRALGFPVAADLSNVLTRDDKAGWTGEKGSRRKHVDEKYRVVAMLGDNLGDFIDGVYKNVDERRALAEPYASWWGTKWIMLPNPAYGSWESAVQQHCVGDVAVDAKDPASVRACKMTHLRTQQQ